MNKFGNLLIVGKSLLVVPFSVEIFFIAAVSNRVWKNAEECQLLVEASDAFGSRVMKSPRPVIAENVAKRFGVTIEEVLSTAPINHFISYETGRTLQYAYIQYVPIFIFLNCIVAVSQTTDARKLCI